MLFQSGDFRLHSGGASAWKIECDALTEADLETLARIIAAQIEFRVVRGVPSGGLRLEAVLRQYAQPWRDELDLLICDDVLTSGQSMEALRAEFREPCIGVVLFARAPLPPWVRAVWQFGLERHTDMAEARKLTAGDYR